MSLDPWTTADPQPGYFDEEIATIDVCDIELQGGNPEARLRIEHADDLPDRGAHEGEM